MAKKDKVKQQFKRAPRKCAYCSERPATTRDHVIPKSLFTRPLPAVMITVPVCRICNEDKSLNDDYLRDMLVADIYAAQHPTARALFHSKVMSSVQQRKSVIARVAASRGRLEPFFTPSGLYATRYYTVPLDDHRIMQIFSTIVKGLYYQLLKQNLPNGYTFDVRRVDPPDAEEVFNIMKELASNGPYCLGNNNEFCCVFMYAEEDFGVTHWLLQFYEGISIIVRTDAPVEQASRPTHREGNHQPVAVR